MEKGFEIFKVDLSELVTMTTVGTPAGVSINIRHKKQHNVVRLYQDLEFKPIYCTVEENAPNLKAIQIIPKALAMVPHIHAPNNYTRCLGNPQLLEDVCLLVLSKIKFLSYPTHGDWMEQFILLVDGKKSRIL